MPAPSQDRTNPLRGPPANGKQEEVQNAEVSGGTQQGAGRADTKTWSLFPRPLQRTACHRPLPHVASAHIPAVFAPQTLISGPLNEAG